MNQKSDIQKKIEEIYIQLKFLVTDWPCDEENIVYAYVTDAQRNLLEALDMIDIMKAGGKEQTMFDHHNKKLKFEDLVQINASGLSLFRTQTLSALALLERNMIIKNSEDDHIAKTIAVLNRLLDSIERHEKQLEEIMREE